MNLILMKMQKKPHNFLIGICFGFIFNTIDFVGFIIFDGKFLFVSSIFYCLFIYKNAK